MERTPEPTPLKRALEAAPAQSPEAEPIPDRELFCFAVGALRFGVPSANVREVARLLPLTPLPRAPSFILGVSSHRGEVLPVVDLLRLLGKGEIATARRMRVLLMTSGEAVVAVVVGEVEGLRRVPEAAVLASPVGGDLASDNLLGVVTENGSRVLHLLNFPRLLEIARERLVRE